MVSDERRTQLNLAFFQGQVHQQWQAYKVPRPDPEQSRLRARLEIAASTIKALLSPGATVLDVGCGTGELAHDLADAGYSVTAVDLVAEMIEVARRGGRPDDGVLWRHAAFSDKVAPRKSIDAVVALGYLEYQERAGKELVRMHRLLKPGGLLILSVPNTLSRQFAFGATRALFRMGKEPEESRIRHAFTPERLQRLLGMAGFILMDYQWLRPEPGPALSLGRHRPFWNHRVSDRLQPELVTLARSYQSTDTAF